MPRTLFLIFILFPGIFAYSQEPIKHSPKTYLAPDGKLYIQKDMPIYLWMSTSPAESSEKHRLISEESKEYSNPMYLDVEGYNSVRSPSAVDTATRKTVIPVRDIIFEIYADATAPVTKISYGNAKLFEKEKKLFTGTGTTISLNATDELAGTEVIYYSLNGSPYQVFSSPFQIDTENEYRIQYYAVDNVGNTEKTKEVTLVYDKSSPISTIEVKGDKYENILSGRSSIVLSSNDNITGVKSIYYAVDSASAKIYSSPLLTANLSQDDHTIVFYAIDHVGNKEMEQSFSFYVDKTAPTIIEEVIGKSFFSGGKEFSSGKSRLKLTSFDNKAGVKEIRYSVNNGEYLVYDAPVFLTQTSGNLMIKSYAVDQVNNRSNSQTANEKTSIPYIDLSGPELDYTLDGPQFKSRDTLFISNNTKIRLLATDYEAGINRIEYSINGSDPIEYSSPYSIEKEGFSTIDFTGYDNVENTSGSSFSVKMDNTGPSVSYTFGTAQLRMESGTPVYPGHTVLFISATDKVVGFQRMTYAINGKTALEYTGVIRDLPKGKNEIKIIALDKLGNSSEEIIHFIIE